MNRSVLLFAFLALIVLLAAGSQNAYAQAAIRTGGIGGDIMPGGEGPLSWDSRSYNPHTMALDDYFSQLPECQLFYSETAPSRKEYYSKRFQYGEQVRQRAGAETVASAKDIESLRDRIQEKQPPRFNCPW
jgi:hypothetical protein